MVLRNEPAVRSNDVSALRLENALDLMVARLFLVMCLFCKMARGGKSTETAFVELLQ